MDKPVLKGTWVFKLKPFPDGTPHCYKARFSVQGDMQAMGVGIFKTYAPVLQWSTIRLLMSTVLTKIWSTCQVDYTNAFAQAELKKEVYVECPSFLVHSQAQTRCYTYSRVCTVFVMPPERSFENSRLVLKSVNGNKVKSTLAFFSRPE